jgi:hypothetical protein
VGPKVFYKGLFLLLWWIWRFWKEFENVVKFNNKKQRTSELALDPYGGATEVPEPTKFAKALTPSL